MQIMNTLAKHTLGPWIVDNGTDSIENMADCLERDKGTEREWIAVGIGDEDGYAESVAYCHPDNAPLISSAPELLDRADELLAILEPYADYWQNKQGQYGDVLDSMDKLRSVINKAIGNQQ